MKEHLNAYFITGFQMCLSMKEKGRYFQISAPQVLQMNVSKFHCFLIISFNSTEYDLWGCNSHTQDKRNQDARCWSEVSKLHAQGH